MDMSCENLSCKEVFERESIPTPARRGATATPLLPQPSFATERATSSTRQATFASNSTTRSSHSSCRELSSIRRTANWHHNDEEVGLSFKLVGYVRRERQCSAGLLEHLKRGALHGTRERARGLVRRTEPEPTWVAGATRCCLGENQSLTKRLSSKDLLQTHIQEGTLKTRCTSAAAPLQGTACRGNAMQCPLEQCTEIWCCGDVLNGGIWTSIHWRQHTRHDQQLRRLMLRSQVHRHLIPQPMSH